MLHEEVDRIAAFATPETLVDLLAAGNGEGGGFFVVERAEPHVVGAAFLQFNEGTDDFHNVYPVEYLLYGVLGDQILSGLWRQLFVCPAIAGKQISQPTANLAKKR